jgi:hypothetical protein
MFGRQVFTMELVVVDGTIKYEIVPKLFSNILSFKPALQETLFFS